MLKLKTVDFKIDRIETLIIPVCEDKAIHQDKAIQTLVKKAQALAEFKGAEKDGVTFYSPTGTSAARVTLLGLGKHEDLVPENLRALAGGAVKDAIKKGFTALSIAVPDATLLGMEISVTLEALGEGAVLGNHLFSRYQKNEKMKPLKRIDLLTDADTAKQYPKTCSRIETVCQGTLLAREWVNTPPNDKPPKRFAQAISRAAAKQNLTISVLDEKILKRKKFGSMLAVAAGSQNKPRLVVLEYRPRGAQKTIALVGKGVTFDSGGLNLKTGNSMETMKSDMSGAAAVAAAMITLAKLKPKVHLVGLMPIVENMPSGSATRPGDIVQSYAGKTVEIGNTDAEGRLILIDAIAYAIKTYKPHTLIDLATLTGACLVALGEKIAGVFSTDDTLADAIIESGERTYERCWRLPLPKDYKEMLKSDFADLKNIGNTRYGGAITAALFIGGFAEDTRWAHIDIAGPAYLKKESAYSGAGATGFGVRLLCDLIPKLQTNRSSK